MKLYVLLALVCLRRGHGTDRDWIKWEDRGAQGGGEVLVEMIGAISTASSHTHDTTTPILRYLIGLLFLLGGLLLRLVLGRGGEEIEAEAGTHKHEAKQGRGGGKEKGPKQSLDAQLR